MENYTCDRASCTAPALFYCTCQQPDGLFFCKDHLAPHQELGYKHIASNIYLKLFPLRPYTYITCIQRATAACTKSELANLHKTLQVSYSKPSTLRRECLDRLHTMKLEATRKIRQLIDSVQHGIDVYPLPDKHKAESLFLDQIRTEGRSSLLTVALQQELLKELSWKAQELDKQGNVHGAAELYEGLAEVQEAAGLKEELCGTLNKLGVALFKIGLEKETDETNPLWIRTHKLVQYRKALRTSSETIAYPDLDGYSLHSVVSIMVMHIQHYVIHFKVSQPRHSLAYAAMEEKVLVEIGEFFGPSRRPECTSCYKPSSEAFQKALEVSQSNSVQSLQNLGLVYLHIGKYKEGADLLARTIALSRKIDDEYELGKTLFSFALALSLDRRSSEALQPIEECCDLFRALDKEHDLVQALNVMAAVCGATWQPLKALESLNEAVFLSNHLGAQPALALSYSLCGILCYLLNDANNATTAFNRSIQIADSLNEPLFGFLSKMSKCCFTRLRDASSVSVIIELAETFRQSKLKHLFILSVILSTRHATVYDQKFMDLLDEVVESAKELGYRALIRLSYLECASFLRAVRRPSQAQDYACLAEQYQAIYGDRRS